MSDKIKVRIRGILPDDIPHILKADHDWHLYEDPDLEVLTCPNWCLTEQGILDIIHQRTDPELGTVESRSYALETTVVMRDGESSEEVSWVCGGFAYELHDDLYGLLYCCIHPSANVPFIIQSVAEFIKSKASKGGKRKEVRLWLRDSPHARIERILPIWQRAGFQFKLAPDWFGKNDGWLGVCNLARKKS